MIDLQVEWCNRLIGRRIYQELGLLPRAWQAFQADRTGPALPTKLLRYIPDYLIH